VERGRRAAWRVRTWAERLDDGRFQVRWRGGEWRDRDGSYRTGDERVAVAAVRALVGAREEGWRRLSIAGRDDAAMAVLSRAR
jgi:hypothetical protein